MLAAYSRIRLLLFGLCGVAVTAGLSASAQAQLVTYQFTGTWTTGSKELGSKIIGTITLDLGAIPTHSYSDYAGEKAEWNGGRFSIEALTDAGAAFGTSLGGETAFAITDFPALPLESTEIAAKSDQAPYYQEISFSSSSSTIGDGFATIPNPWTPLTDATPFLEIGSFADDGYEFYSAIFSVDTFELLPTTLVINGHDTGIEDFELKGQRVSAWLRRYAAEAPNHGQYVKRVAKLAKELQKLDWITGDQKGEIVRVAAESSIVATKSAKKGK